MATLLSSTPRASATGTAVVAAVHQAKDHLVVQPRPDALGVAQVALFPVLAACGVDVFDLDALRGTLDGARLHYRARVAETGVQITVQGVGEPLPRGIMPDHPWRVHLNGGEWSLGLPAEPPYGFSLYDEIFPRLALTLFGVSGPDAGRRGDEARRMLQEAWLGDALARLSSAIGRDALRAALGGGEPDVPALLALLREHRLVRDGRAIDEEALRSAARVTLRATELGVVRPAAPLSAITQEDLERHAGEVAALRGRLRASFDGRALSVTSRSGLYYVLAALALQHGREDTIPSEDLVVAPDRPPPGERVRPLGRPGWFLRLERDREDLEEATAGLVEALGLGRRLRAEQRGHSYAAVRR